ncbi:hypothetical protein ACPRNU_12690 [Chromobacterium vaccinii]|uniref:hypothetical protein n=1 Tax=Chromobacterium vaccinii TaxID=1108595 RepID=UPI003C792CD8
MGNRRVANSLSDAIERQQAAAEKLGLPAKRMADLMGVELKTYYRWLSDNSMPLNRVRQWETFGRASYVSEYLCTAHGNRVVITIPAGKKATVKDIAGVQANAANALALLAQFYQDRTGLAETVEALTAVLTQAAYHRENVLLAAEPELELFGE